MTKSWYMLIEVIGDGPKINGRDTWLCFWGDCANVLRKTFESMDEQMIATLRFTQMEMTDSELADWCDENDVEWEG